MQSFFGRQNGRGFLTSRRGSRRGGYLVPGRQWSLTSGLSGNALTSGRALGLDTWTGIHQDGQNQA